MNQRRRQSTLTRLLGGDLGLLGVLLLICVALAIASPYFRTLSNSLNILRQVSINFCVAVGMTYVILAAQIDLSVGSVAALAGVLCAQMMLGTHSIAAGIGVALLAGIVSGAVSGLIVAYLGVQSFIVTLAMMGITRGVALVVTGGFPVSHLPEAFGVFGSGYVGAVPVITLIALGAFLLGQYFLASTKHGLHVKSIGSNAEAARLSAVPIARYQVGVFILSGVCAALGGVLISSRLLSGQPTAGAGMEMDVIAAVILGGTALSGGVGTLVGTLLGSLIIGVINNGLNILNVSAFYQQIFKGLIILVAVMLKRKDS